MDKFTRDLDAAMAKLVEYDKLIESRVRTYGTDIPITMSEIHTIEAIGNHPQANITELADVRGLTKGTLSKLLSKLEKNGLVRRYQFTDNKKECYFQLTATGQTAYNGHYALHESLSRATHEKYKHYTDEQRAFIIEFLDLYIDYLKSYI